MKGSQLDRPIEILLAEDSAGDARLTKEAFSRTNLSFARDGQEALDMLRRQGEHAGAPRPDFMLLDLNMPRLDGRELLALLKTENELKTIPVMILTTSSSPQDVMHTYGLGANAFVTKPVDIQGFHQVIRAVEEFWLQTANLPCFVEASPSRVGLGMPFGGHP
jgi:CheY-like chemotaxis protein